MFLDVLYIFHIKEKSFDHQKLPNDRAFLKICILLTTSILTNADQSGLLNTNFEEMRFSGSL